MKGKRWRASVTGFKLCKNAEIAKKHHKLLEKNLQCALDKTLHFHTFAPNHISILLGESHAEGHQLELVKGAAENPPGCN